MIRKLSALTLAVSIVATASYAHKGATGVVRDRMMAMENIGQLMKQLSTLDWSNVASAQSKIGTVSLRLIGHSNSMSGLFPDGSNSAPSEALAAIWTDKSAFAAAIGDFEKAGKSLNASAGNLQSAADLKPFIIRLGQTCSACHRDFRKKQ